MIYKKSGKIESMILFVYVLYVLKKKTRPSNKKKLEISILSFSRDIAIITTFHEMKGRTVKSKVQSWSHDEHMSLSVSLSLSVFMFMFVLMLVSMLMSKNREKYWLSGALATA